MEGFIKLHRQLLEWEWYDDIKTKVLFIHLLLRANHKEGKWRGNTIQRGELITSLGKLSEETGLTVREVRTCINRLKSTNEMTSKGHATFTLIKLLNYDKFQSSDKVSDKPTTSKGQANDKQTTTNNNEKNKKNENNKKKYINNSYEYIVSEKFLDAHIDNKSGKTLYQISQTSREEVIQTWCDTVEKLQRIDGYSEEQISFIIDFTIKNDFWINQIQSMQKFRKKNKEQIPYFVVMIDEAKKGTTLPAKKGTGITSL